MAAQPACVQSLLSVNAVPKQALLFQHNDADHEILTHTCCSAGSGAHKVCQ